MADLTSIRAQYPQYNDMSDADLAGALHAKFYSDMPAEDFNTKIGLTTPTQLQPDITRGQEFLGGITKLIPFGAGEELAAGSRAAADALQGGSFSDSYNKNVDKLRQYQSVFSANHPVVNALANTIGVLDTPIPGAGEGGALATTSADSLLAKAGKRAVQGALTGELYGLGTGQGGIANRASSALSTGGFSSVFSPLAGAALDPVENMLGASSKALDRKSIGARASDYLKSANEVNIIDVPEEGLGTLTKKSIDDLMESGELGTSRKPASLLANAKTNAEELNGQIAAIISDYDSSGQPGVVPTFDSAKQYIASGKVPADRADTFLNQIVSLKDAIKQKGQGYLAYLQQQKIAIGDKWDPSDKVASKFYRALYGDIQTAIEKAAPAVGPLNKELQKYKIVTPILQRSLGISESGNPIGSLMQNIRTSGGVAAPVIAGAALGHAPLGLALSGGLLAAKSPTGLASLSNLAGLGGSATNAASNLAPVLSSVFAPQRGNNAMLPMTPIPPQMAAHAATMQQSSLKVNQAQGMIVPGNITNLFNRPVLKNADGSVSTTRSMSFEENGKEVLVPTVVDGKLLTNKEAIDHYHQTGEHLGKFNTPEAADVYSQALHEEQANRMGIGRGHLTPQSSLMKAIKQVESSGNPNAVSSKGAVGTHQVTPVAMRDVMRSQGIDDGSYTDSDLRKLALKDGMSELFGTAYMNLLLDRYKGDERKALLAYNQGIGNVAAGKIGPEGKKYANSVYAELLKAG